MCNNKFINSENTPSFPGALEALFILLSSPTASKTCLREQEFTGNVGIFHVRFKGKLIRRSIVTCNFRSFSGILPFSDLITCNMFGVK